MIAAPTPPRLRPVDPLTPRETEVLALLATGMHNRELAEALHVSQATVHHHLLHVYDKLGVSDRVSAAAYAWSHGLAPLVPA